MHPQRMFRFPNRKPNPLVVVDVMVDFFVDVGEDHDGDAGDDVEEESDKFSFDNDENDLYFAMNLFIIYVMDYFVSKI